MSAAEFDAAAAEARSKAEARRAREVRRGVGSTAAARRIGGFSPGSGPGGGGDFDAEDEEGEAEAGGREHQLVASMSVSSWALSFAGLSPREAAAAAALGRRAAGAAFSDDEDAEGGEGGEEQREAAAVAAAAAAADATAAAAEATLGAAPPPAAVAAVAAVSTAALPASAAPWAHQLERALDGVRREAGGQLAGSAPDSAAAPGLCGELASLAELLRAADKVIAELAQ
jgi:hypothetical protein